MSHRHLLVIGLIALAFALCAHPAYAEVAIIAHPDVAEDSLSGEQVRDIYNYDTREWRDRQPVLVLDMKEKGDIRSRFYDYLGKSSSRMKSIWMKKMLTGEGDPPEVVADEKAMIDRVAAQPGAIGFVNAAGLPDSVKVLAIIQDED